MNNSILIKDKVFNIFIKNENITKAIKDISDKINKDFNGKNPLFIVVLNGAFMFAADLMKEINIPCELSFIKLSSYSGLETKGHVKNIIGLSEDIDGRDIIIVEDIIDSGYTMQFLMDYFKNLNSASVSVATLLFKSKALKVNITPDYIGFDIPNDFIVGFGLDYDGQGRNYKHIYKIEV